MISKLYCTLQCILWCHNIFFFIPKSNYKLLRKEIVFVTPLYPPEHPAWYIKCGGCSIDICWFDLQMRAILSQELFLVLHAQFICTGKYVFLK